MQDNVKAYLLISSNQVLESLDWWWMLEMQWKQTQVRRNCRIDTIIFPDSHQFSIHFPTFMAKQVIPIVSKSLINAYKNIKTWKSQI